MVNTHILKGSGTLAELSANIGVLPTGANALLDVRLGTNVSTSSIFTSDAPLEISSTAYVEKTTIDNGSYTDGTIVYVVVTQVGSTVAGADLSYVLN